VWDEENNQWVVLEGSTVNTAANSICAPVSRFTTFTIIGTVRPPEEAVLPEAEVIPPGEEGKAPIDWWLFSGIYTGGVVLLLRLGSHLWLESKQKPDAVTGR